MNISTVPQDPRKHGKPIFHWWGTLEGTLLEIKETHIRTILNIETQKEGLKKWKRLNERTVPLFKRHPGGTVPPLKIHPWGTVPLSKIHLGGTVSPYKMHSGGSLDFHDTFLAPLLLLHRCIWPPTTPGHTFPSTVCFPTPPPLCTYYPIVVDDCPPHSALKHCPHAIIYEPSPVQ